MSLEKSQLAFERAKQLMPGGVNSPARAFGGVGGEPIFFERGEGPICSTSTAPLHRLRRILGPNDSRPRPPGGRRAVEEALRAVPVSAPPRWPKMNWPS